MNALEREQWERQGPALIQMAAEAREKLLQKLQALEEWFQRGQREGCDPPPDIDRRLAGWFALFHEVTYAAVNWGPLTKPGSDPDP